MKTLTPSYGATMTEHPDGQYVALADHQALVKQQQIDRNNALHTVAQLAKMSAERDALVFELNALRLSTSESLELAEFKAAAVSAERDALRADAINVLGHNKPETKRIAFAVLANVVKSTQAQGPKS